MVYKKDAENELNQRFFETDPKPEVQKGIQDVLSSFNVGKNDVPLILQTFVNIAVYLGNGNAKLQAGLLELETALEQKARSSGASSTDPIKAAQAYFADYEARYVAKRSSQEGQTKTVSPYSKLLTEVLKDKEIKNGFSVSNDGVPIYLGRLADQTFLEASKSGKQFKDLVSARHGEYTHRIQWYLIMRQEVIGKFSGAMLFRFINIIPEMWDYLFDRVKGRPEPPNAKDDDDYRCPEIFLAYLINQATYPLLGSFLEFRQKKREKFNSGYGWAANYASRKKYNCDYENLTPKQKEEIDEICKTNLLAR